MVWVVIAIIVAIGILAATMVGRDDPFKTTAATLGIELSRSVPELLPRLDGIIDGLAFKIDIAGNREPGIRYRAFYPDLGMALRLERETSISRTLGELGSGDQTVGTAEFDQRFRVNTSRPDAFKTMMTPELQRQLIDLIDRYPSVLVKDGEIVLQTLNTAPPADEMIATSRDLLAVARALDAARPAPLPRPGPKLERRPPMTPSQPAERRTLEPEDTLPTEPTTERPSNKETEQVPPPSITTGLPDGFFEDAFGANRLSFEKDDRFDAIQGTTVTLTGTVKHATGAVDETAGTKVIVTVAQIENDLYGKTDIDAVVYLTNHAELDRGQTIVFTGVADGIDAFMRNLFVKDAALVE